MALLRCLTCALALAACDAEATAPSAPAAVMLGRWQYATLATSRERPSLNAGLQVTLAIDSVQKTDFGGHVERWFAGDVGISPDAFGPIVGKIAAGDQVVLTIPF